MPLARSRSLREGKSAHVLFSPYRRADKLPPSRYSSTSAGAPRTVHVPKKEQTFGWRSAWRKRASSRHLATRYSERLEGKTLMATEDEAHVPCHTVAYPPRPMSLSVVTLVSSWTPIEGRLPEQAGTVPSREFCVDVVSLSREFCDDVCLSRELCDDVEFGVSSRFIWTSTVEEENLPWPVSRLRRLRHRLLLVTRTATSSSTTAPPTPPATPPATAWLLTPEGGGEGGPSEGGVSKHTLQCSQRIFGSVV
mmetsp:Transcript_23873/g.47696  ORF Transcript_23873/g.47696 Transcript_23873/m.47696 type:complete len:251 (+) Transcript_23873:909-1661(+)